jgi:HlyD family secretion protein
VTIQSAEAFAAPGDQPKTGRQGILRFPAFNQRTTPEVKGGDKALPGHRPGQGHGAILLHGSHHTRQWRSRTLADHKLLPGMPVEPFIETSRRTALSFLTKPLTDQFERTLRER